ncbi:MAG: sugar phosphate isomerase/epimerase family protein [Armatimonadota bacterium]|nr:sugar phosphate isomerase/epimerase family protein [Armatimonadota bacterium]
MGQRLKLGVIVSLGEDEGIEKVNKLGLPTCQIACWDPNLYNNDNIRHLRELATANEVEVTTIWTGYPGPAVWNFTEGPSTIGLVPPEFREMRIDTLKRAADFAKAVEVPSITTHAGFIPENPADPLYAGVVEALIKVARHCRDQGVILCFETGQETPVTLLRLIRDIGTDNLGVNLDPANLLMYGKANPIDALDLLGPYIKGVHAKDGEYPTEPGSLGVEKPLGQGRVNFPLLIPKLKSFGYSGALTIEREISGERQITDIKKAMEILEPLC